MNRNSDFLVYSQTGKLVQTITINNGYSETIKNLINSINIKYKTLNLIGSNISQYIDYSQILQNNKIEKLIFDSFSFKADNDHVGSFVFNGLTRTYFNNCYFTGVSINVNNYALIKNCHFSTLDFNPIQCNFSQVQFIRCYFYNAYIYNFYKEDISEFIENNQFLTDTYLNTATKSYKISTSKEIIEI